MRAVRRAGAFAALLPCLTMAAPVALASPGAAAAPERHQAAQATGKLQQRAQVSLSFTEVTPKTLRDNSRIEISGLARNRTDGQLSGLTLRLRYSAQPVTSRSQLDQYSSGQPNLLPNVGPKQQLTAVTGPGTKQNWTFKTTPKALGLRPPGSIPGVYPVGIEVLNPAQQVIGGTTTFLTSMPKQKLFKPVSISWVWPLIDRMHRTEDRTFFDDQLTKDMSPGGRLSNLVSAASSTGTPLTWGIDPALLDDAQRMAAGDYSVRPLGARKGTEKGKNEVAARWLAALKSASKGDSYFTVPYGDPDVVALVRHKTPRDIRLALDPRNTTTATQVIGREPDEHIAWPPYGLAGPGTLEELAAHALKGGGSFLMSSAQFQDPAAGTLPNATTALRTKAGTRNAVVYDDKLNKIVSAGSNSPAGALLSEQRFLAETAMIAAEAPNQQRSVVVAPDRNWNPAPGLAERLLTYTKDAGWLRETPLRKIESAQPQERAITEYPDEYERYELGDSHLAQTRAIARRFSTFRAVMTGDVGISYERALLRLDSVAWRRTPGRAKAARKELATGLENNMQRVRIVTTKSKRILMGGSSGKLPVLVENKLHDQSVKVRLVATSENSAKLQLGQLDPEEAVIELRPGERAQRWIPAKAAGNGNFRVRLDLTIPDSGGRTFGRGETVTVRTTGYGRLALLITGGGLAVLFVGVGVRAIRARRRRKAEAAGDGSTGVGSAGTAEPGNGHAAPGFAGPGLPGAGYSAAPGPGLPDTGPELLGTGSELPTTGSGLPGAEPALPTSGLPTTGPGPSDTGPGIPGPGEPPAEPDIPTGDAEDAGDADPAGIPPHTADAKPGGRRGRHAADGRLRGGDGD